MRVRCTSAKKARCSPSRNCRRCPWTIRRRRCLAVFGKAGRQMRRKPGTDTKFPAQFAGNWLSVPGFALRETLRLAVSPQSGYAPRPSPLDVELGKKRYRELLEK